jgi:hypothetical protein
MKLTWISILLVLHVSTQAQKIDTLTKKYIFFGGYSAFCGSTFSLLKNQWYSQNTNTSFHWFNDNHEWGGMDKLGHIHTCYQISRVGIETMKACGFNKKTSAWIGGFSGTLFMTGIEYLDGRSQNWGASPGDLMANTLGGLMGITQSLNSTKLPFCYKYSFVPNKIANSRPNLLGSSLPTQMLKNYNGQTYWLSYPISRKRPWLLASLGYGINGYYGGDDNIFESNGIKYDYSNIPRYSEYYLSLDVDFTKIPVHNKLLKKTFFLLNYFKFPFPVMQYTRMKGISFLPVR